MFSCSPFIQKKIFSCSLVLCVLSNCAHPSVFCLANYQWPKNGPFTAGWGVQAHLGRNPYTIRVQANPLPSCLLARVRQRRLPSDKSSAARESLSLHSCPDIAKGRQAGPAAGSAVQRGVTRQRGRHRPRWWSLAVGGVGAGASRAEWLAWRWSRVAMGALSALCGRQRPRHMPSG